MTQVFLHKTQESYHGWNPVVAELIKDGHHPDLIVVDESDPRVQAIKAKTEARLNPQPLPLRGARAKREAAVEVPASAVESADKKD